MEVLVVFPWHKASYLHITKVFGFVCPIEFKWQTLFPTLSRSFDKNAAVARVVHRNSEHFNCQKRHSTYYVHPTIKQKQKLKRGLAPCRVYLTYINNKSKLFSLLCRKSHDTGWLRRNGAGRISNDTRCYI